MRVVYLNLLLLLVVACGSSFTHYRMVHEHYERNPQYVSMGIWLTGEFWVEFLDDTETTFPFDEAIWKSKDDGTVDYIDRVLGDGSVQRSGWNFEKKGFVLIGILEWNAHNYSILFFQHNKIPI